jgi:hypothetical protein
VPRGKSVVLASLALVALASAACSGAHRGAVSAGGEVSQAATVSDPTTTTEAPTTTTAAPAPSPPAGPSGPAPVPPPPGGGPLTGFAAADGLPSRPALVVKIDNGPRALPQAGINQADVVFEEQVEGGITRLAAVFQSESPGSVGPVRSARSTDIGLVSPLSGPLFAYSGANKVFLAQVRRAPLVDVGADKAPGRYHRDGSRPVPDNLFSSASALFALAAPQAVAPPALFAYHAPGEAPSGAGAKPAGRVHAEWGSRMTTVDYLWDAPSRQWRRTQNGRADVDTTGTQVAPSNVVIQFVGYRNTGLVDPSGSAVPEAQVVGEGDAWVLTGGSLIPAHWSKPSAEAVTHYVDANGAEVLLAPGRTWVELVPPGKASAN